MSQHDGPMMRAKLHQALDRIGKSNGHAAPHTGSNIDPVMHEYFVCSEAEAYFKKRRESAKAALITASDTEADIADAKSRVEKNDAGETIILAQGEAYVASAVLSRPAERLDKIALANALMRLLGMSPAEANEFISDCSKMSAPATTIKVAST